VTTVKAVYIFPGYTLIRHSKVGRLKEVLNTFLPVYYIVQAIFLCCWHVHVRYGHVSPYFVVEWGVYLLTVRADHAVKFLSGGQIVLLVLHENYRSTLGQTGTALQTGRWQDRFPMVPLEFFIDIILPAALWPWGRLNL
jgi:hypothetical protein